MRIPYYQPSFFNEAQQIHNPGTGGPQSHMGLRALAPRSYPTIQRVGLMGLGAMPRLVMGPTLPVDVNAYSNPLTVNNLEIAGLAKNPVGG